MLRTARGRIVGWMVLLVALALAGSVATAHSLLAERADDAATSELTQEAAEFQAFAASEEARSYRRVDELLARYLSDNLPDSYEAFFSVVEGRPDRRGVDVPGGRLDQDAAFVAEVASSTQPESGWWDSRAGQVRYGSIPVTVQGDPRAAHLALVVHRDVIAAPMTSAVRVFAAVSLIVLIVAGGLSWLVAGRVLAPVRLVRTTAENITETDLRQRIAVEGNDDVAALANTFNRMLDRLEQAFAGHRQFLDDAGHELRTPLTIVRGHLELLDDDPLERAATTALVMDEVERMNRIIDDLLLLAKAERPDFLSVGEVDVADLTVDAAGKARLLADRRWGVQNVADAVVLGDPQRLSQALLQLAANAVAHTQPGDQISFGSALEGDRLRLWVADTGPGVPEDAREAIFDRFARGAGAHHTEGSGLGLAIVRSIALAHSGDVTLADRHPGATFVLDLPARLVRCGELDETDPPPTQAAPRPRTARSGSTRSGSTREGSTREGSTRETLVR